MSDELTVGQAMTAPSAPLPEPKRWAITRAHGMVEAKPGEPSFVDSRDYDALRARLQGVHAGMREAIQQGNELFRQVTATESRAAALQKQRDEEIDEFNAGYEAYKNGVRLDDLPSTPHDQMGIGWAWAAIGPLQKELEAVRNPTDDDLRKGFFMPVTMSEARMRWRCILESIDEASKKRAALSKE